MTDFRFLTAHDEQLCLRRAPASFANRKKPHTKQLSKALRSSDKQRRVQHQQGMVPSQLTTTCCWAPHCGYMELFQAPLPPSPAQAWPKPLPKASGKGASWWQLEGNNSMGQLSGGPSIQLSWDIHKCSADLGKAVSAAFKHNDQKTKARGILQASWAWPMLRHREIVFNIQLNFEMFYISDTLWCFLITKYCSFCIPNKLLHCTCV